MIIDHLGGFSPRGSAGSPRFALCRHLSRWQIYCLLERNWTGEEESGSVNGSNRSVINNHRRTSATFRLKLSK